MSLCAPIRKGLLSHFWTPAIEQLRFRNRINLKRPLPEHFDRARVLRVCEPKYAPAPKICQKYGEAARYEDKTEESAYAQFLAKNMRKMFYEHPMIAIFHANPTSQHEILRIRGMLFDANFDSVFMWRQNSKVGKMGLTGTKFEPVMQIFKTHSAILYCKSTDVSKLIKLVKKMPSYILLGIILDGRLMHKEDYELYANSGGLDTIRGQLCNTLSLVGGLQLSSSLTSNIKALSHSLSTLSDSHNNDSTEEIVVETPSTEPV